MTSTHLWLPLQDPEAGTHVCKENTIAERNVSDLSFVYLLFKSWTDRVTHLGSLEYTLGSLLTSKATPQAAENIIIIEFGVWSKQSHILIAIQNLDMGTTNILIALIYRLFNKGKEGICPPHGSFIAKREEDMHAHSQGKTRYELITHATCNLRITHSTKNPSRGCHRLALSSTLKRNKLSPIKEKAKSTDGVMRLPKQTER